MRKMKVLHFKIAFDAKNHAKTEKEKENGKKRNRDCNYGKNGL